MKATLFFLAGMVVSLLIIFAIFRIGSPISAEDTSLENDSPDLESLLPDIKGIYQTCLTEPFKQVETEIRDPDIAKYYHQLMQKTGLIGETDQ